MPEHMTDEQIVAKCNELARLFYKQQGYQTKKGYRFDRATHPQERGMWHLAAMAYYFISGTDPDEALAELEAKLEAEEDDDGKE
jgi:hypothetical protein